MALAALFGKKRPPEEILRQNQRDLSKVMGELDRERSQLERQEKILAREMKMTGRQPGEMDSLRTAARDVVRARQIIQQLAQMKSDVHGISLKLQTLDQSAVANAIKRLTKGLKRKLKPSQLQKVMMEFKKECGLREEPGASDASRKEEEEELVDALVTQTLEEVGISLVHELPEPVGVEEVDEERLEEELARLEEAELAEIDARVAETQNGPPVVAVGGGSTIDDLQERLDRLRSHDND